MSGYWGDSARETIARVHATLPGGISFKDRKDAIRDAYPFGPRKYWPYRAWCKAQREYLRKYDPSIPAPPLFSDRERILEKAGEGISFPFAEESRP